MADISIGLPIKNNAVDSNYMPLPNLDSKYGPYDNVLLALASIPTSERAIGLTIGVRDKDSITEYWFNGGITDNNLVLKQAEVGNYTAEVARVDSAEVANAEVSLADSTFKFSFDLPKGEQGNAGPMIYPAGVYDMYTPYIGTAEQVPYVYDTKMNAYYVLNYIGEYIGAEEGMIPNPSDDLYAWKKMDSFETVYNKVSLIPNGLIGPAVFNGTFMFSQHGVTANGAPSTNYKLFNPLQPRGGPFTPNICINFRTGETHMAGGTISYKGGEMIFGNLPVADVQNPFSLRTSKISNSYSIGTTLDGDRVVDSAVTKIDMGSIVFLARSSGGASADGVSYTSEFNMSSDPATGNRTRITLQTRGAAATVSIEDLDAGTGITLSPNTLEFHDNGAFVVLTYDKLEKLLALVR